MQIVEAILFLALGRAERRRVLGPTCLTYVSGHRCSFLLNPIRGSGRQW